MRLGNQNIIDARIQPKQFAHTKLSWANNKCGNNSSCCHAQHRTAEAEKPKQRRQEPKTKISLVMKDIKIKSKSQQHRHEIEATCCQGWHKTTSFSRSKVMSNNGQQFRRVPPTSSTPTLSRSLP